MNIVLHVVLKFFRRTVCSLTALATSAKICESQNLVGESVNWCQITCGRVKSTRTLTVTVVVIFSFAVHHVMRCPCHVLLLLLKVDWRTPSRMPDYCSDPCLHENITRVALTNCCVMTILEILLRYAVPILRSKLINTDNCLLHYPSPTLM